MPVGDEAMNYDNFLHLCSKLCVDTGMCCLHCEGFMLNEDEE